ncbi:MAG: hypothetical protein ABEJ74_08400 [Haloferacaceae archaeon]
MPDVPDRHGYDLVAVAPDHHDAEEINAGLAALGEPVRETSEVTQSTHERAPATEAVGRP